MRTGRIAALLLAALLLVTVAGEAPAETALGFSCTARMPLPAEDGLLSALAGLLEVSSLTGTWVEKDGSYTLEATLSVGDAQHSASMALDGVDSHWSLSSPLLGDTRLMFNNQAMLEFGLKMDNHLGVPLYRAAWLYPYVHRDAWAAPLAAWHRIMDAPVAAGHVPPETLLQLGEAWLALYRTDRAFSVWMDALDRDTGLGSSFGEVLEGFPDWVETCAPDGIDVETGETGDSWYALSGDERQLLYTASGNAELTLPGFWCGEDFAFWTEGNDFSRIAEPDDPGAYAVRLRIGEDGETLSVSLLLDKGSGRFTLTLGGGCLEEQAFPMVDEAGHLVLASPGETEEGQWTLEIRRQEDGQWAFSSGGDAVPWLLVRAEAEPFTPDTWPAWNAAELPGINFFSLNDTSLEAFLRAVLPSAVKGAVPLVAAAPADAVARLMDWLEEIGLLSVEP